MFPMEHKRAKCQKGSECRGPGCKVRTGKTRTKREGSRPPFRGRSQSALDAAEAEDALRQQKIAYTNGSRMV